MIRNPKAYASFHSFWPFYLSQHSHVSCRRAHFIGSALGLVFGVFGLVSGAMTFLFVALGLGYGFAWFGHFVFEKNRPATFQYPLYSFMGDWKMFWLMLTGKLNQEIQRNSDEI